MTQMISLKLKESMLKEIDAIARDFNFSNRTDFIRNAVREKLDEYRRERALELLKKYHGAFKGKSKTDEEFRKMRKRVFGEFIKERGFKL